MKDIIEKANIICEALPYISRLAKKIVVIKYGGNAMLDDEVTMTILQDIATLQIVGVYPVLVHGGGADINKMLKRLNIESKIINGLRVTDGETMEIVQMVLCGSLNKNITGKLNTLGVNAIGICGKDSKLIEVKRIEKKNGVDYGFVGDIRSINASFIMKLLENDIIPVISSVGVDSEGNSYNINADTAAAEIAAALTAEKIIFLTDVDGVRRIASDNSTLISEIGIAEIQKLIAEGVIADGMIPKMQACVRCIQMGINRAHIVNGTISHPILLEIFTDKGIGTMVTA